jgi:hypothetical protein
MKVWRPKITGISSTFPCWQGILIRPEDQNFDAGSRFAGKV